MDDIKLRGLGDVVFEAIPLGKLGIRSGHSLKCAILVDLAVLHEGIQRVLSEYGNIDFVPLSDKDPIILAQEPHDIASKKALAYQHMYTRYLWEYKKRCKLANVLGYELNEVTKAWFKERLRVINNHLLDLGYY
ncbi:hypothetical protein PHISCL_10211 [Aspergillus sclerotialis]|uniref:Uncharacterized protein n=1 Tax=Aspergillus sclerotialis TaxID=2070753 RepID=A0A3A2Z300_9EURO|nr:hypothetical protein PHISCL_10211 [Aspergillus sclerotialis]